MKLPIQVMLFCVVGVVGFCIDTYVLYLLKASLGNYVSRLISFFCAASSTWLLNRTITFRDYRSAHKASRELMIYIGLMALGGCVNYGIYVLLVYNYRIIALNPVIGVAAGSLSGMLINLSTSRLLLYRIPKC
jgi:putative flippase GtrA